MRLGGGIMEKIVSKGLKIDLHIHSRFSSKKDGSKVSENTIENLPVLIKKLEDNDVGMCAITDHDTFNYNLYKKLKEEENKDNCIRKVLPGIEFSVEFEQNKEIHIVTIFDDKDDEKVKKIEEVMTRGIGKERYHDGKYTRRDYFDVLDSIGIDFVMIAHQKKSIMSTNKPKKHDVLSLGQEVFNELVFLDYFDAFEFRSKKNEVYNKAYALQSSNTENLRFITGSDCHKWEYYPFSKKNESEQLCLTFIKSLPTFKGLAMAITDNRRIGHGDKFFNVTADVIDKIELEVSGNAIEIPLSKGINVIIGDNSIGKSLFLHAITNNQYVKATVSKGYSKYLNKNGIVFKTIIPNEKIFKFNGQGAIREIFDDEGMKPDKYLAQFYPNEINAESYKDIVLAEFENLYKDLKKKFEFDYKLANLPNLKIIENNVTDKGLTFIGNLKKMDNKKISSLIKEFQASITSLEKLCNEKLLDTADRNYIMSAIDVLSNMLRRYEDKQESVKKQNIKINAFNTFINMYEMNYTQRMSDEQVIYSNFLQRKGDIIESIVELIEEKIELEEFEPNIEEVQISPEVNFVDRYCFVSKVGVECINNKYIWDVISEIIKKDSYIDTLNITENELKRIIKKYPTDEEISPIEVLKEKITTKVERDFKSRTTIVEEEMDVYNKLSSGFDAQTYFSLICGETRDKGIYLIDQPEDNISQKAIKDNVLNDFKRMAQNRQIIMVTHNPQFIVNLDVDNVVYLSKKTDGFYIQSGALEYEDDEYSILKIIAENIEGGLPTIMGRMKRYEKNI